MRTWYVPPHVLDPQRVLAQHREIHTIIGSLMSTKRGYQNHPVVKLYAGEHMACLLSYHEVMLDEFRRRGWHGHRTPISDEVLALAKNRVGPSTCSNWFTHVAGSSLYGTSRAEQGINHDMHDLVRRWAREGKTPNEFAVAWVRWHCYGPDFLSRCTAECVEIGQGLLVKVIDK